MVREVRFVINGCQEGDIREVSTPVEGIVEAGHIAWGEVSEGLQGRGDTHGHGAKVDRHVIPQGYGSSLRVEEGARVVAPFFDIG